MSSETSVSIYKLDQLEYQYHYLTESLEKFEPRYPKTTKLYNCIGKKNKKKVEKLLSSLKLKTLNKELDESYSKLLNNKIHYYEIHLSKCIKEQIQKISYKGSDKVKDAKKNKTAAVDVEKMLGTKFSLDDFVLFMTRFKLIKILHQRIKQKTKKIESDMTAKAWLDNNDYSDYINDKTNQWNPSKIWNDVITKLPNCEKLNALIGQSKTVQNLVESFDLSICLIFGFDVTAMKAKKYEAREKPLKTTSASANIDRNVDNDDNKSGINKSSYPNNDITKGNRKATLDDEDVLVEQYEGMLGSSGDEEEGNGYLNPNIDYNEVTDEEPSEESSYEEDSEEKDSDAEENEPRRKKAKIHNLPELMAGYYSGDDNEEESDDDGDLNVKGKRKNDTTEDRTAREQMSNEPKRKNRRGQRARRKIWEKKYGSQAKHVQKELEKEMEDRKQRQIEYEARVAKREAKEAELYASRNKEREYRLTEEAPKKGGETSAAREEHPSWIAKRVAEEKLQKAKFEGKKIKFD
ncbi:bud22p [Saccharomyces arboricola H-6]|uniref:Bud22p n=1 Tax=Saccharomyces arboricola (strain H-6 / AS 2.3317 / CBS 10644) TaxID=1160507 RepID=J8PJY6_SACAR|nr:bud22p [Saccharomyces arboricola H-6]